LSSFFAFSSFLLSFFLSPSVSSLSCVLFPLFFSPVSV
jgi:hypothetical protein